MNQKDDDAACDAAQKVFQTYSLERLLACYKAFEYYVQDLRLSEQETEDARMWQEVLDNMWAAALDALGYQPKESAYLEVEMWTSEPAQGQA